MSGSNPILDRVYGMEGRPEESREVYAEWAEDYDRDTVGFGYVGPALVAEKLAAMLPKTARVLDAGCGTGLAGEELAKRGFTAIDGNDVSPDMLQVARHKGVYRDLSEADLTRPLDIPDATYDGVVCAGVFTSGHVGPQGFDELLRVAKPGAPVVATVHENVWDRDGYAAHLEALAHSGRARIREAAVAPYHENEGYDCRLCVLEAL